MLESLEALARVLRARSRSKLQHRSEKGGNGRERYQAIFRAFYSTECLKTVGVLSMESERGQEEKEEARVHVAVIADAESGGGPRFTASWPEPPPTANQRQHRMAGISRVIRRRTVATVMQ